MHVRTVLTDALTLFEVLGNLRSPFTTLTGDTGDSTVRVDSVSSATPGHARDYSVRRRTHEIATNQWRNHTRTSYNTITSNRNIIQLTWAYMYS